MSTLGPVWDEAYAAYSRLDASGRDWVNRTFGEDKDKNKDPGECLKAAMDAYRAMFDERSPCDAGAAEYEEIMSLTE